MNECFFNGMEWNAMGRIDPINQGREAKYCSLARVDWGSRAGGVFFLMMMMMMMKRMRMTMSARRKLLRSLRRNRVVV